MFEEVNHKLESRILELRSKCQKVHEIVDSSEFHRLELVQKNAKTGSVKANFLMDQINNFDKRQPVWSDISLKYCEEWRKASEKGYNHI
ncbi:hypothetical protein B566_EDAN003887 [Ephemera danica]|nr:hypothetical protein B566_EDAN003887 [Ephemera danica]